MSKSKQQKISALHVGTLIGRALARSRRFPRLDKQGFNREFNNRYTGQPRMRTIAYGCAKEVFYEDLQMQAIAINERQRYANR